MRKQTWLKRTLAFVLSAGMVLTNAVPMVNNVAVVEAASSYENENLLKNPTFDEGVDFQTNSHVGNWYAWKSPVKTQEEHYSGTTSVKLSQSDTALEQDVPNLIQGMTYEFKIWAKISGENTDANAKHYLGVKNYGGTEIKQAIDSTEWKEYILEFTYSGNQDARVYCWVENINTGGVSSYIDDASLTAKGDIVGASVSNGQLEVDFSDWYTGEISKDKFRAVYRTNADLDIVKPLEFTGQTVENKKLTMTFQEVEALPVEQIVTVDLTYTGATEIYSKSITLDYTVEANGEPVVEAEMDTVTAENGVATVVLKENPTMKPVANDFSWQYKTEDGEFKTLAVNKFIYDAESKTITVNFTQLRGLPEEASIVTVKVTRGETEMEVQFEIPQVQSSIFYVSAEGDDANAGTSEEAPIKTIAKLNTMTFYPGDQILFRKGDTFVGCFKPVGSGTKEAPITIGSYGTAEEKPVLQPGADFTVPRLMSANALVENPTVNYVIWFYNVEYWELSDLELEDPQHETTYLNPGNVYRSGITIQAEDAGTLEHIYVDNMEIHGFHGPHTNIGKSSGGITMNVLTDFDIVDNTRVKGENCTPTQINDIRVTNCEIYNVGRSGINFLTPWSWRNDEKWGPFDYGTRGFDYLPYEDFYMGNNYIHDIDGDGTIIDNCSGAVAEYNLVTRCVLNTNNAAVGLFNWNSDDTTFQYNEVFDIRYGTNESNHLNDSQGIEIDALNDRTWVQYNYVHDNTGGFMMLCNTGDNYRSFDGIVRYNISQNDYAHPRQGLFDIYSANWGTEIYNNSFYLTERAISVAGYGDHVDAGELFLFSAVGAGDTMKFYNNIFYFAGNTPATVNTFGDNAIDWQSNIFYNFANMPVDDNADYPNLKVDPKWADPGKAGNGEYVAGKENLGYQTELSGYYLTEESPAINAGVPISDNGGKDYFGNVVEGIPDIGAYETGSVVLKVLSDIYAVNEENKTIGATGNNITAGEFKSNLAVDKEVDVVVTRRNVELPDGARIASGDVVIATYGAEKVSYTVVVEGELNKVPLEVLRVTAGTQETQDEPGAATNAIDGKVGTIWHSNYSSGVAVAPENKYITLELLEDYSLTGYEYTPRISGGKNGIITAYEIYASNTNNGSDWELVACGNADNGKAWADDSTVKTAMFEQPVQAKYIKLLAKGSHEGYVTAAEIGLFGEKRYTDQEAPSVPEVKVASVTGTTVELNWTESSDGENGSGIKEYRLKQGEEVIAVCAAKERSFMAGGLEPQTEYTFVVVAVDIAGNEAISEEVKVTTLEEGSIVVKMKPTTENAVVINSGDTVTFVASVIGNDNKDVTWSVAAVAEEGKPAVELKEGTKIAADTKNSNKAVLSVDETEISGQLAVTATSIADETKKATTIITVVNQAEVAKEALEALLEENADLEQKSAEYTQATWNKYLEAKGNAENIIMDAEATLKAVQQVTEAYKAAIKGLKKVTYTVSFNSAGGSKVATKTIVKGQFVTEPTEPTRNGYIFEGWYLGDANDAYDFETAKVTENITLTAKWESKLDYGDITEPDREEIKDEEKIEEKIWVAGLNKDGYTYNGGKLTPDFRVYDGNKKLEEGVDYTVSYKNNQNVYECVGGFDKWDAYVAAVEGDTTTGLASNNVKKFKSKAPQVILKMKGDYTGSKTVYFEIAPVDIEKALEEEMIALDNLMVSTANKKQAPTITVLWDVTEKALKQGKDYKVVVKEKGSDTVVSKVNLKNAADYDLTLEGIGNFTGEIKGQTFKVVASTALSSLKVKLNKVTWDGIQAEMAKKEGEDKSLTDTEFANLVLKEIKNGSTEIVLGKEDCGIKVVEGSVTNKGVVGNGTLMLEAADESFSGTRTISYTIAGTAISKVDVRGINKKGYSYTGTEIELLELTNEKGEKLVSVYPDKKATKTLVQETHFDVKYDKHTEKGNATLTLTGKPEAGYTGTKKVTYKINAYDLSKENAVTVELVNANGEVNAEKTVEYASGGATPKVKVMMGKKELKEGNDYTLSYKNNKAPEKADAKKAPTVTVKGKGSFTKSTDLKFTIDKKAITADSKVEIVVNDKEYKKGKTNWKQSFKVMDENGKAISNKEYTAKYTVTEADGVYELSAAGKAKEVPENSVVTLTVAFKADSKYYEPAEGVEFSTTFRILEKGKDISKATVKINEGKPIAYTGAAIQVEDYIVVTMGKGKKAETLTLNTQYKIKNCENNVNKGTAKVTIEGLEVTDKDGNVIETYGGEKTVTFKIGARSVVTSWWSELMDKFKDATNEANGI